MKYVASLKTAEGLATYFSDSYQPDTPYKRMELNTEKILTIPIPIPNPTPMEEKEIKMPTNHFT